MTKNDLKITDIDLLRVIAEYVEENTWAPSVRDIIERTPLTSKATVFDRFNQLEKFGFIERKHGQARAIRLTERGRLVIAGKRAATR